MVSKRSYAVVGTGAVGTLYGAHLQAAGHEVHFLVRDDYEYVAEHGLVVESARGDVRLEQVHAYRDTASMPRVDVVLVCWKTTSNTYLHDVLAPLARPGTTVVMLQNGLGNEEAAAAALAGTPGLRLLGGLAFVCAQRVGPGVVRHIDYGRVNLGEYDPDGGAAGATDAVLGVRDDFAAAGWQTVVAPDLVLARWQKLVWNVPYNGLAVVLDAQTDVLTTDPAARELVRSLMQDVQAGAAAEGREIPDAFVDKMLEDTAVMTPYAPSMKLDFDLGRPLELDAIYATPLRRGTAGGAEMPRAEALYRQLAFLDGRARG